jgi:hypothetical protein
MEFVYLLLVIVGGVIVRYLMPILDVTLELVSYWIGGFASKIVINTQREQFKFKKEVEAGMPDNSPKIGFHFEPNEEEIYEDEFEDEEPDELEPDEEEDKSKKVDKRNLYFFFKNKVMGKKKTYIKNKIKKIGF